MTVLLDSSGWIELLGGSSRAGLFEPALTSSRLLVPSLVRYEVGRYVLAKSGNEARLLALRAMAKFDQVPIDADTADAAAVIAAKHKLAMADALIYATAKIHEAELWTQDAHFENLSGVRFFSKT
ncbi:MAG: type II toxin-antitoxin system VapC family toxin [Verrucomicrobia bacterium]|nr:type II toxin-antitoxin system VapC family toxin [Verrucomicrobiota bacterium]